MCEPLLAISVLELGRALCFGVGPPADLALIPEEELAGRVWENWQSCLRAGVAGTGPPPSLARQHQVLRRFAAAFWRPHLLRLSYPPLPGPPSPPPGLSSLALVASRLEHLELSAASLPDLHILSAAGRLRCLSLRGCVALHDASLAALPTLTSLQALDLGGLAALSDAAVFHAAKLPSLRALNLSGTAVTDASMGFLAYGHKVAAWQAAEGVETLPPAAAAWPPLALEHLRLAGTRVGPPGLQELHHLPQLRFLDARHTGVPRSALGPLQRRFALQAAQAAVLTDSSSAAAAVLNLDAVACCCGRGGAMGPPSQAGMPAIESDLHGWQAEGVRLLLRFDPAAGLRGVLDTGAAGDQQQQAAVQVHGGRRTGYRQPRESWAMQGSVPPVGTQHFAGYSGVGPIHQTHSWSWS